jgi:hypothetical protein
MAIRAVLKKDLGLRRPGCKMLLCSLVVLMVIFPNLVSLARPLLLTTAVSAVLLGGVLAVEAGHKRIRIAITLAALQTVLIVLASRQNEDAFLFLFLVAAAIGSLVALFVFGMFCVMAYVLRARVITHDQIYAGISVYFLLGFAFGAIYYLVLLLAPGSFSVNVDSLAKAGNPDLMYFSFVTLVTLGFGDITPIGPLARSLTQLEAVAGTLYMAIFMARLVSLHGQE